MPTVDSSGQVQLQQQAPPPQQQPQIRRGTVSAWSRTTEGQQYAVPSREGYVARETPQPTRYEYGYGYDVRDLAAWAKTEEGWQYGQSLMRWQHENLVGRPGVDYDVRDIAMWMKTPTGKQWQRENLFGRPGIDYDVRDLAMAAKLHPEWFVVTQPQPQPEPTSHGPFVNWEEPSSMGVPLAIWQAPGGYVELEKPPSTLTQIGNLFGRGTVFRNPAQFEGKVEAPEYWFGDPITGKYGINPGGKEPGATYAWSAWDIYNITTTALLVGAAAKIGGSAVSHAIRGTDIDIWLAKHSSWYYSKTGGLARGEVSLPEFARYGMGELEASSAAFDLTNVPRTSGVWIRSEPATGASESWKPLVRLSGVWQTGFLPYVTQQQVTRLGIHPYIPAGESMVAGPSVIGRVAIGTGIIGLPELYKPLITQPGLPNIPLSFKKPTKEYDYPELPPILSIPTTVGLMPKPSIAPRIKPIFGPRGVPFESPIHVPRGYSGLKPREDQMLSPMLSPLEATVLTPLQKAVQIPRQVQRQRYGLPSPQVPRLQPTHFRPFPFRLPKSDVFGKKGRRGLLGSQWWFKRHAVATPRFVAENMILGKKKKGRRR